MKKLIAAVLCLALAFSTIGCGNDTPSKEELSQLVADAILSDNTSSYYKGECCGEGHKILGSSLSGDRLKVYALTMYGNYGFQNDMFVKVSGSGVIPAVLTFKRNGLDFILSEIEYPRDGAGYVKSIKRMFPLKYRMAALKCDETADELVPQERTYAEAYLQSIGRDAEIGEFRDLNVVLLTDLGISVEVSNQLSCNKSLGEYPFWIGSSEYLENGKRFVRSLTYQEAEGQIVYETVEKESGAVTERFVFDAASGKMLETDSSEAPAWDLPLMITICGKNFFAPHLPVRELPEGYTCIGELPESAANDTGLAGCKMYAIAELDSLTDFYLFQECGTPTGENTVDQSKRQWAYVQWVCRN